MKKQRIIFYTLMLLPLALVITALQFLPAQIPAHYGWDHQVTRWGSKYETLIFPIMTLLVAGLMIGISKAASKYEDFGTNNERVCISAGIAVLMLLNILTVYYLYVDFNKIEKLSDISLDIMQLVLGCLGISMIVLGNIMPKVRKNSVIGLRTVWSVKNEGVWKKSQRFGGISFIIAGSIVIAVCFLTEGISSVLWTIGVLGLVLAVDIFYTYNLSKQG